MKQLSDFKVRASSARSFMSKGRGKDVEFGKTSLAVIDDWVKAQIYGKEKDISSKHTNKGTAKEADAIDFAAEYYGWQGAMKNETQLKDAYFTGTPDVILPDLIVDIKCSWDCYTFPLFEDKIPTDDYYDQLQVYMHLTGAKKSKLVYCLMDAPDFVVESEARRKMYARGEVELSKELYEQVKDNMTYEHFKPEMRIKSFDVEYNPVRIAEIQTKVFKARAYIEKNIQPKIITNVEE